MRRIIVWLAIAVACTGAAVEAQTVAYPYQELEFLIAGVEPVRDENDTETTTCFLTNGQLYDVNRLYVTSDSTFLYVGLRHATVSCACSLEVGIAIDTGPGGSNTDPLGHQIEWSQASELPDRMICDLFNPAICPGNQEALFGVDGAGGWTLLSFEGGEDQLGIVDGGEFHGMAIPFDDLGIICGQTIQIEAWLTTPGTTKPAYDMVVNDSEQRSTPAGTEKDTPPVGTAAPSRPTAYVQHIVGCGATPVKQASWGQIRTRYR